MEERPHVNLYSDGGAEPNPGNGGFGVILSYKGIKKEFSQGYKLTTNNRMEIMAVIFGLEQLKKESIINVFSDSQYVVNGVKWAVTWKKNNWFINKTQKAKNVDLWEKLLNIISKHEVTFNWVKGHAGHSENERCDQLSTAALQAENLIEDTGYLLEKSQIIIEVKKEKIVKGPKKKVTKEGDLCTRCGQSVILKIPKHKKFRPDQIYCFDYYFYCTSCKISYMVEEAKRIIK